MNYRHERNRNRRDAARAFLPPPYELGARRFKTRFSTEVIPILSGGSLRRALSSFIPTRWAAIARTFFR